MKLQLKIILISFALVGCSAPTERWVGHIDLKSKSPPLESYLVKKGDTLYGIAWLHDLDYKVLARWNQIKAPAYLIYPGQHLKLTGPPAIDTARVVSSNEQSESVATVQAVKRPGQWHWPLASSVAHQMPKSKAILIKGKPGEVVRAAADGTIVYSNFNLKHYEGLVIIKHKNDVFSAYGYNDQLLVKVGGAITSGQPIARLPKEPDARLYFELRQSNRSLSILRYFPTMKISARR